jgi:2-dehydro-3-deoxyphosphogluconate aldolase/(4S)-4-hydroxy-2-oxoglutarate aldolase
MALGVGGDLVDNKAIRAGKPEVITDNARKYLDIVAEHQRNINQTIYKLLAQ